MLCFTNRMDIRLSDLRLTWAILFSTFVLVHGIHQLHDNDFSITNECDIPECEILPPPPPVEDEEQLELFDLLARGSEFLDNYTDVTEAIVLLGNTGSGKSTLTQIIAGNLSKLHSVLTSGCTAVIIDEDNKIGLPSTKSKTMFPELVFKPDSNSNATGLAFYDFPGFDDTRGDVQDIAANFFMNQVITKISSVKFLFLVTHSSVNYNDRVDFDLLATHAATFVKNLEKYMNSFALVVTKVGSYNSMGRYIEDSTVISGIVEFLNKFLDDLRSQLSNNPEEDTVLLNKIMFVETLIYQDPTSSDYSRIWFVRSPLDCGPLNEQEMIHHTKNNITKLYDDLSYTGINPKTDFGFTLKAETKIVMTNYTRSINSGISSAVNLVIGDFQSQYFKSGHLVDFENLNFTSVSLIMHSNSLPVKSMVEKLENGISNSIELSNVLKISLKSLKYHVPSKFHSFMGWQEEYLTFFDEATGENQERLVDKWSEPIVKLNQALLDLVDWYEFCLVLENHVSTFPFQSKKYDLPSKSPGDSWLNYIDTHQIVPVSRQIQDVASRIIHEHLNVLDVIMTFAMDEQIEYCDQTSNAIVYQGNFVQLSKLPNASSFTTTCGNTTTQLYIFASRTIFLDIDINLENLDIVMIAPIWNNPRETEVKITLAGKSASYVYPKAASGSTGQLGSAGCMGVAGNNGGSIFGISNLVKSLFPITIISQGGKGGKGQEGGNGGPGPSTRDANRERDWYDRSDKVSEHCWFDNPNLIWQWGIRGQNGKTGGDGGMPGIGGRPVDSNNISLVILQDQDLVQFTGNQGDNGLPGTGGRGGSGGAAGRGYFCQKHCDWWECWPEPAKCGNGRCPGDDGSNGGSGKSSLCQISPDPLRDLLKWPAIVKYRTSFFNHTDLTTTRFFVEIDKRDETRELFTLKALAEESLALESLLRNGENPQRLNEVYTSLVSRLEHFSKISYHSLSNEHKKIVTVLFSLTQSSVMNLKRAKNHDIIVDVSYYFSTIERQINSLSTFSSLQAIRESKETLSQNLKGRINQAFGFMQHTVAPAIEDLKQDLDVKVNLLKDVMISLIEDADLSFEEMKDKLRKTNGQQDLLNFLTIFSFVGNFFTGLLPIPMLPPFDMLVKELEEKYINSQDALERLTQLVNEAEKLVDDLREQLDEFEDEFQPLMDSVWECFKNISDSLNSEIEIEPPQLFYPTWQVNPKLKEFKNSLNVIVDESLHFLALTNTIDLFQNAVAISIDIFENIEEYLETATLAKYISTVNSAELGPISISDPNYVHTVANFDVKVKENLLYVEVAKANHAFKQWTFPFAKFYFGGQSLYGLNQHDLSELGAEHLQMLENLRMDLERYKEMSVGNHNTFIILTNFSSELKTSNPFFTWTNDVWRANIHSLISGNEVNFKADVRMQGMEGWEAIKFKLIEINFKLNNPSDGMQEEFDDVLEYFGVSMTHSGVSYYRFQQDYFMMTGANQTLSYNFEKDVNGNRLGTNQVYEKFKNGDFLLSPFTTWSFQLRNVVPTRKSKLLRDDVGFDRLEKFLPYMDLELVGMGTYTDGEAVIDAAYGDMKLDLYYERDERNLEFNF